MIKLALILHAMIATTLMGIAVTFVLAMQMPGWQPIVWAVVAGFVAAIPVSWLVARQITHLRGGQG